MTAFIAGLLVFIYAWLSTILGINAPNNVVSICARANSFVNTPGSSARFLFQIQAFKIPFVFVEVKTTNGK